MSQYKDVVTFRKRNNYLKKIGLILGRVGYGNLIPTEKGIYRASSETKINNLEKGTDNMVVLDEERQKIIFHYSSPEAKEKNNKKVDLFKRILGTEKLTQ